MTIRRIISAAAIALFAWAAPAAARPIQDQSARGAPGGPQRPARPGELATALDQYAVVEARRMLQLDGAQHQQFVPRLRALQQTRRRSQQARNRILQDLRRLAGPRATGEADEAALRERVAALREHDERAARELRAAHDAIDEILDARQQARFRIFEENIEARKLELLMRARARSGG